MGSYENVPFGIEGNGPDTALDGVRPEFNPCFSFICGSENASDRITVSSSPSSSKNIACGAYGHCHYTQIQQSITNLHPIVPTISRAENAIVCVSNEEVASLIYLNTSGCASEIADFNPKVLYLLARKRRHKQHEQCWNR